MVDHIIITAGFLEQNSQRHGQKLAAWVITTGKSCLQPCFAHSFEYCFFQSTWHPETLSDQSITSRNSTAVTHFIKKQQLWNAKCNRSQCRIRWTQGDDFEKQAMGCSHRLVFKQPFYLILHWA